MEISKSWDWRRKSVDRLSSLPDDILINILAFLPTKIYVATSILGRRWRFLWARVPNLDFDDEDLPEEGDNSSIINRVMYLHNRQNINSFRFRQSECRDYNDFEKWITTAIRCNVQELDLCVAFDRRLPICIFTSKTLVNLSFSYFDIPIFVGTVVFLPALKKLQLDQVYFKSVECFHHLLSGCPVLNEFIMLNSKIIKYFIKKDDSERENNKEICISLPTISRLELEINHHLLFQCSKRKVYRLKYDTPALKYLKFKNHVPQNYSSVSSLAFSASAESFHNLTDIELEASWHFFPSFLEKAGNLKVLTIKPCCSGDDNATYWIDPEQVPACLVSHLKTVRFLGFGCKEQEFKVVRYILRNAKVLRRMEIHTQGIREIDLNKQHEALKRISLFERESDACQLAFD